MISGNFHIFDVYCWHVQLKCDFPKLFLVKIICYTNSIHIFCALLSHELQLEDYRLPQGQISMCVNLGKQFCVDSPIYIF